MPVNDEEEKFGPLCSLSSLGGWNNGYIFSTIVRFSFGHTSSSPPHKYFAGEDLDGRLHLKISKKNLRTSLSRFAGEGWGEGLHLNF